MSITSTRRISTSTPTSAKSESRSFVMENRAEFVENIDTSNNVLVRGETDGDTKQNRRQSREQNSSADFSSPTPNISTSIEALALSGIFEENTESSDPNPSKVSIYNNNQTIIKDEEVERTGRNYLKHFYEKNEHIEDIDKLV